MSKQVENYINDLKQELELTNDINKSLEIELKIELLTNQLIYEETTNLETTTRI